MQLLAASAALLGVVAAQGYPPGFIDFGGGTPSKGKGGGIPPTGPPVTGTPRQGGTGPYKGKMIGDQGFTGHTLYQPVTAPKEKQPVLVYANNGCLAVGTIDAQALLEIASYGYFVITHGSPTASLSNPSFSAPTAGFDAINWITDQVAKGKFPGVDPQKVIAAGTSCGGFQAYTTSQHKQVLGAMLISSGLFGNRGQLPKLTKPLGYFEGGSSDMATSNGKSDYNIVKAPATWANGQFGHGQINARRAAGIIAWMNWIAKGNESAGKHFFEPNDPFWRTNGYTEVKYKNWAGKGKGGGGEVLLI